MALRFCRAGVDTPYVLLSTPLMRKLVLSEHTDVPRPCEGSKTLHWGPCSGNCPGDLDGDGVVGGADLGLLFIAWGDC